MKLLDKMHFSKLINPKLSFTFSVLLILSLFLAINSKHNAIWIITSIILPIPLVKQPKWFLVSLIGIIIAEVMVIVFKQPTLTGYINDNFIVKKVYSSGFVVKYHGTNLFIGSKVKVGLWDGVHVSGQISQPVNWGSFDYVTYLKTLKVANRIQYSQVDVLYHSADVRSQALDYLSTGPDSYKEVTPLMVLGQKTAESKPFYEMSIALSVVHLFVISGFHISLIYTLLYWICKKTKIPYGQFLALVPILVYLFMLNFPISATRACALTVLGVMNKELLKSKFNSLQVLSFVMAAMFLINPWSIYSLSFIFTFTATFVIIYINGMQWKTKRSKWLAVTIGVYLSTLPISISVNHFFSLFGIIFGVVLAPVFVVMYVLTFILMPFKDILCHIQSIFIQILTYCSKINVLIHTPNIPLLFIQSLYLLPTTYLIINRKWNLFEAKKTISSTEKSKELPKT